MCERRQRKIRCVERERLRANLAAVSERNGQAATVPRTGRKARISKADMSRSDTRFQDQISGERRATYWLPHGKVDSHADD